MRASTRRSRWSSHGRRIGAGALFAAIALPVSQLAAQTSLTIYNDGRVPVRRTLSVEVPKGPSSQRVALGQLDPATVFSLDSSVVITGLSYDGAVDQAGTLRRAVGRRLTFRAGGPSDTVSAILLGVDPERYKLPDGSITFSVPGVPRFPDDLVVVDPFTNLTIQSSAARKDLRLGFLTTGAQWLASYQVLLGTSSAQMTGAAVLTSQTLKADNAEVQLLAGNVSQAMRQPSAPRAMYAAKAAEAGAMAEEEKVGEFHLYSLPGKVSLLPGVSSSVALFTPASAKYEKSYVVRGLVPYWGALQQYGEETDVPVTITYLVSRPRKTEFGDRPLPAGTVRIYQPDSAGRAQLVGETTISHTPAGEDLRLAAGEAFDIKAKRVQLSYQTKRDTVSAGVWKTSATAEYRVTVTNAGDKPVTVDVLEERGGEWSVISSSVPAEKLSSTVTRFRISVPAAGNTVLRYKVKVIW